MKNPLLKLIDISKYYSSKDVVTLGLRKVNAEFQKGEFVAITGESGSGKSTLLNVLSGIDSYEDGEMLLNGNETSCYTNQEWDDYRRDNIAFIFQDYNLIDSYTVLQNVELPLYDKYPKRKERRKRALELLEKVGLYSHRRHRCTKLSGGQKQRVAIARALAKDAPIILADEPTGNLDSTTSQTIIKLMAETAKDKLFVMVTHSFDDVKDVATRRIRMHDGNIVEDKNRLNGVAPKEIEIIEENKTTKALVKENSIEKGETEEAISYKKRFVIATKTYLKKLKKSYSIALNNLIATPRRSLFVLSTSFFATLMLAFFLFSYINIIYPPAGENAMGDRKDTMFVISNDRSSLDENMLDTIKSINGINAVMKEYSVYRKTIYPKNMNWEGIYGEYEIPMKLLTTANFQKKMPLYGTVPQNDNEILLGWANKGKPDLTLIGKEIEIIMMYENIPYYGGMQEDSNLESVSLTKKYILSGYDSDGSCYLTKKALEQLSIEYNVSENLNAQIIIDSYTTQSNEQNEIYNSFGLGRTTIISDANLTANVFYYVYNPTAKKNGSFIWENYDFTDLVGLGEIFEDHNAKEIHGSIIINNDYQNQKNIKIRPATPTQNASIYNAYIGEDKIPLIVTRSMTDFVPANSNDATALVVIDTSENANKIIERLSENGFKVIYPFSRPLIPTEFIKRIINQFLSLVAGLVIMLISVSLISEVYSRVSKSKKKDFNIFRTVGLSNSIIKSINYAEFLIINVVAFAFTLITFVVLVIVGNASGSPKLTNAINSLLPFGALHIKSLIVYATVFVLLMLLTFWIAAKVYKKIFKTRVKKSLVENA